jgi:hypothetical protein
MAEVLEAEKDGEIERRAAAVIRAVLAANFEGPILTSEEFPPLSEHDRQSFVRDLLAGLRAEGLELRVAADPAPGQA